MNAASARFFSWVQDGTFYIDLHRDAVNLVDATQSAMWIDVGCGPGLVARLAAERGMDVLGIDTDPAMIRAAGRHPSTARFEIGDIANLATDSADVVSATSLLYGAPDPAAIAAALWAAVRPGGTLLVVETSLTMTVHNARWVAPHLPRHHRHAVHLWARSRNGHSFDRGVLDRLPAGRQTTTPLLHGLVEAILLIKQPVRSPGALQAPDRSARFSQRNAPDTR